MTGVNLTRSIGEYVVYKKRGVFVIESTKEERIGKEVKVYYVLRSVYDEKSTVYVPADSEVLVSQMENVLTKDEIDRIIEKSKEVTIEWKTPAGVRSPYLEEIVKSFDLSDIIAMYILLRKKRAEALSTKTKVFAHDERMLSQAQKIIFEAFSHPLGLKKNEVISYVFEKAGYVPET